MQRRALPFFFQVRGVLVAGWALRAACSGGDGSFRGFATGGGDSARRRHGQGLHLREEAILCAACSPVGDPGPKLACDLLGGFVGGVVFLVFGEEVFPGTAGRVTSLKPGSAELFDASAVGSSGPQIACLPACLTGLCLACLRCLPGCLAAWCVTLPAPARACARSGCLSRPVLRSAQRAVDALGPQLAVHVGRAADALHFAMFQQWALQDHRLHACLLA